MVSKKSIVKISVILVVLIGVVWYWNWKQPKAIDFSKKMPEILDICGVEYQATDSEYLSIRTWFEENKVGWKNNSVNYFQVTRIFGEGMLLNIFDTGVVVNYQAELGYWKQVVKPKSPEDLSFACG